MRISAIVSILMLTTLGIAPLSAQTPKTSPLFTVGVNGGWFIVGGEDFDATDDGPGVGGYLGVHVSGSFNLLAGAHYSSHEVTTAHNMNLFGVFVEPRFVFGGPGTTVDWFLGGRLAWVNREIHSLSSTGYAVGGIAGLLIGSDWPVRIEPALTATYLSFSPYFASSDRNTGSAISIQVGLSVPL